MLYWGCKVSEQIKFRVARRKRLLTWIDAQNGVTIYQIFEWLFDNYALGEKTRQKDLQDLRTFGYVIAKGDKFYIAKRKKHLW